VPATTSFADRLEPYMAEWASVAHEQNVITSTVFMTPPPG
jgi:hypothetical protein